MAGRGSATQVTDSQALSVTPASRFSPRCVRIFASSRAASALFVQTRIGDNCPFSMRAFSTDARG
jgi:hypothetical protein